MGHHTHTFIQDNANSHQAWLWVTSLLALIYSILVLTIRVLVRWRMLDSGDAVLGAAYVLSVVAHVSIYVALHNGLGNAAFLLAPEVEIRVAKLVFVTRILLLPVLDLSKISIFLFVQKMFSPESKKSWMALRIAIIFTSLWCLATPLMLIVGCHPENILVARRDSNCTHGHARYLIMLSMEGITEIAVIILPIFLCTRIQLRWEHKVMIYVSFGLRITMFPVIYRFVVSYLYFSNGNRDNIGMVPNLIFQEILVCHTLILATTPCLRTFVRRFNTGGIRDIVRVSTHSKRKAQGAQNAIAAVRALAAQIRDLGACSIFDALNRRGSPVADTGQRENLEHQHWASVMQGPTDKDGIDVMARDVESFVAFEWEKKRAGEITDAPRRASVVSITFITTAEF